MNKSFTLIEILVVIVVIGILSSFILVGMSSITDSANIAKGKSFANSLRNSLLMSLVSEWKFDNISGIIDSTLADGTLVPDSWGANSGTTNGLPTLKGETNCINGNCLSFNGSNYITSSTFGLAAIVGEQLTVELWVKFNVVNINQYIITKNGPFMFLLASDSKFRNMIYTGTWTTNPGNSSISANKWYYTVMVYDGSNIKSYLNGLFDGSTAKTGSLTGDGCLQIGRYTTGGCTSSPSSYLNGYLDELRIYKAVLSQTQIKQNYIASTNSLLIRKLISSQEYVQMLKGITSR